MGSKDVDELLAEADSLREAGSIDPAIARYEQVLELDSDNAPAKRQIAVLVREKLIAELSAEPAPSGSTGPAGSISGSSPDSGHVTSVTLVTDDLDRLQEQEDQYGTTGEPTTAVSLEVAQLRRRLLAELEQASAHDSDDPRASELIRNAEKLLGSLDRPAELRVPKSQITWHKLDHRAAFLLSNVDGSLSYEDLIAISGLPRLEALKLLVTLFDEGLVETR